MENLLRNIKSYKIQKIQMDDTLSELHNELLNIITDKRKWLCSHIEDNPKNGLSLIVLETNPKQTISYLVSDLLEYAKNNDGIIDIYAQTELSK